MPTRELRRKVPVWIIDSFRNELNEFYSIHYCSAESRFKHIVRQLINSGWYPGPTVLNNIIHNRDSRNLDGRETRWRREVMTEMSVPLINPDSVNMHERIYGDY